VGGLGDIGSAQFAVIGVLAALRQRERTGEGQYVDIAMLDAMVSMTDLVTNFWSLGLRNGQIGPMIMHGFKAGDGWFIMQVGREHEFERLTGVIGTPEWLQDERLATRDGWMEHLDTIIRPAVEQWASTRTKIDACRELGLSGIAAGPCLRDDEVVSDPHVAARDMLVEMPRVDGVDQPILIPGNPVRMSKVAQGPETRVPWLGEHTDEILGGELGLSDDELADLRNAGAIG
jgi:formyl-CoA transferase